MTPEFIVAVAAAGYSVSCMAAAIMLRRNDYSAAWSVAWPFFLIWRMYCALDEMSGVIADWVSKKILTALFFVALSAGSAHAQSRDVLAEVELGKILYHDPRMSADASTSCSTCHNPKFNFADDKPIAEGMRNHLVGTVNSPPITNHSPNDRQFLDLRARDMFEQSLLPLTNPKEMGNASVNQVVRRLNGIAGYRKLFNEVYGTNVTAEGMRTSIVAFEQTLVASDAPVHRLLAGDRKALSTQAARGYEIFRTSQCAECHRPPNFTDNRAHNTGVDFRFNNSRDQGLSKTTGNGRDARSFKTPTLLNTAMRPFRSHVGVFSTLDSVVEHYARGGADQFGNVDPLIDPRIHKRDWTAQDKQDLAVFLYEGMTTNNYPKVTKPQMPQ